MTVQREFPAAPLVGVGAVVFDAEGRVLLIQRGREPLKGRWTLPGGLVELGESLEAAVTREIAEETGLIVVVLQHIEVVQRIYIEPDTSRVRYHYIIHDYLCRLVSGKVTAASDAGDAQWAPREAWAPDGANPFALDQDVSRIIGMGWRSLEANSVEPV
jgi:8-oxo-dGTP diphosphatase